MLDIFSQYATDDSLENNGTWREIGAGAELLIARVGNRAYAKLLSKLVEQNKEALSKEDDAAAAKSEAIMVDVLANTVLLGWRSKNADGSYESALKFKGKVVSYTVDAAKEMLGLGDFRKLVARLGDEQEAYRFKEEQTQGEA